MTRINEIVEYILKYNGPDEEGKAHHKIKRISLSELEKSLKIALNHNLNSNIKPYHFKGTLGVWKEKKYINEVLAKKIDQLLGNKYNGSVLNLITETGYDELFAPFVDRIDDKEVKVSMCGIEREFRHSTYLVLSEYLKLKNLETEFSGFKPYHMKVTPNNTWNDINTVNEVLVKKIDQLLDNKYKGSVFNLITQISSNELMTDFVDKINNKEISISMRSIINKFKCTYIMLNEYLKLKNLETEFSGFRPYHMKVTSNNTWNDINTVNEVLVKKIDQLLDNKYKGSIFNLITETSNSELLTPFVDKINNKEVNVSMGVVCGKFENSAYLMLIKYLKLKNLETEFSGFKPYHMKVTPNNTWDDINTVNEVLVKKIDQLLDNKYKGSIFNLITETNNSELLTPFVDEINNKEVNVSMRVVIGRKFKNSPYLMIDKYFKIKNRKLNYSKSCFIGTPECRKRKISGNLNNNDLKSLITKSDNYNTAKLGFIQFDGKDKDVIREIITESYMEYLGEEEVKYLGLESEGFKSLKWFAEFLNYNPSESTIIERDNRVYNIMLALKNNAKNDFKLALSGLEIRLGDFDKEIKNISKKYNLINFDTCGHLSEDKERSLNILFENQLLDDKAMLYVTLDCSNIGNIRAARVGFENQIRNLHSIVLNSAEKNKYNLKTLFQLEYHGGCTRRKRPMVTFGYFIEKEIN